jgi:hypothetical protein
MKEKSAQGHHHKSRYENSSYMASYGHSLPPSQCFNNLDSMSAFIDFNAPLKLRQNQNEWKVFTERSLASSVVKH